MNIKIKEIEKKSDERGWLFEFLHMDEVDRKTGQFYTYSIKPGFVRGNHYHARKNECFGIVKGKVTIILQDLKTKEKKDVILEDGKDKTKILFVPKNIIHAIKNTGKEEAIMIAYIDEIFNSEDADTFFEKIA